LPPRFVDVAGDGDVIHTGDFTADRGDAGVVVGIPAHTGAVAGAELGCSCDGDASAALIAPKDWDRDLSQSNTSPMFCAHATADR
jgi:hypothetical protein